MKVDFEETASLKQVGLATVAIIAPAIAGAVLLPTLLVVPFVLAIAVLIPGALIVGIVYGQDWLKSCCIGALIPSALHLTLLWLVLVTLAIGGVLDAIVTIGDLAFQYEFLCRSSAVGSWSLSVIGASLCGVVRCLMIPKGPGRRVFKTMDIN